MPPRLKAGEKTVKIEIGVPVDLKAQAVALAEAQGWVFSRWVRDLLRREVRQAREVRAHLRYLRAQRGEK